MMRHLAPASLILLSLLGILCAQPKAADKSTKIAVLVGVNKYSKPGFEELQYAERDMTRLKAALEAAGFKVTILLGSASGDGEATVENIRKLLLDKTSSILKTVTQEDTVLVAFSGHGQQIEDKGKETPYFCPKHAVSGDPDTQISINEVLDALDQRGGGSNLVLVDACRKFTKRVEGRKSGASMDRAKVQSLRERIGVMFACSDRQEALENAKAGDGHGLFFYSVLEAMKSAEKNAEGEVTWERLVPRIREKVKELVDKIDTTTPKESRQRPQYIGNFSRDPVLIAAGSRTEPKPREERSFEIADGVKMVFCWIPAGEAQLGSPKAERDVVLKLIEAKEEPDWLQAEAEGVRRTFKTKGFWLGKYAVTQQEWSAVGAPRAEENYFSAKGKGNASVDGMDTSRFPTENVSWDECQDFLKILNRRDGTQAVFGVKGKFVLPHEDEWEYAYRGGLGNKRPFYWGESLNGDRANCDGNYPYGTTTKGEYKKRPEPVGSYASKAPHPWGLCDMSGNVYQWCGNLYSSDKEYRVLRGGSWSNSPRVCRAAYRSWLEPGYRDGNFGFRVAFRLDP